MDGSTLTPTAGRTSVNPHPWSRELGFDQARLFRIGSAMLSVAAQGSLDPQGRLVHEEDPAAQLALTLANFAEVLHEAGMAWADVVQLRLYTTDLDRLVEVHDTLVEHLDERGAHPPTTILEVSRLLLPGMTVAIDGLAVR